LLNLREAKPNIANVKIAIVEGSGTEVISPELVDFISIVEYSALVLLLR
jgi:hypothetical protein